MAGNIYAIYKGDEYVDMGTAEELAERLGVKVSTIRFWRSKANHRRASEGKGDWTLAIKVEEDEI